MSYSSSLDGLWDGSQVAVQRLSSTVILWREREIGNFTYIYIYIYWKLYTYEYIYIYIYNIGNFVYIYIYIKFPIYIFIYMYIYILYIRLETLYVYIYIYIYIFKVSYLYKSIYIRLETLYIYIYIKIAVPKIHRLKESSNSEIMFPLNICYLGIFINLLKKHGQSKPWSYLIKIMELWLDEITICTYLSSFGSDRWRFIMW